MRNSKYTTKQANNVFASINRAFKAIRVGDHVQFVTDKINHAVVAAKWFGVDKRLVVVDDKGQTHYLRDLSGVSVLSHKMGGYVPAVALGDLAK